MGIIRSFFLRYRALAFALIAFALALKAIVPAGYMVGSESKVLTIRICEDAKLSVQSQKRDIAIPMEQSPLAKHGKSDSTCSFTSLSLDSLGGADPVLLVLALLFIVAAGFAALALPATRRADHLRPPLRGPPALI
jgi:hypothetical protein